jgi:hypothetical protein
MILSTIKKLYNKYSSGYFFKYPLIIHYIFILGWIYAIIEMSSYSMSILEQFDEQRITIICIIL